MSLFNINWIFLFVIEIELHRNEQSKLREYKETCEGRDRISREIELEKEGRERGIKIELRHNEQSKIKRDQRDVWEEISRELELAKEGRERGNKFETCLLI